jgi:hypothetical protein
MCWCATRWESTFPAKRRAFRFHVCTRVLEGTSQSLRAGRICYPMIPRNAEPIGHISPYPRIDHSPVRTTLAGRHGLSAIDDRKRIAEADRIWRLVVQAAEGNGGAG